MRSLWTSCGVVENLRAPLLGKKIGKAEKKESGTQVCIQQT